MSSPPLATGNRARRFFAPEVIQTSAMDCGPAALKCLLEGQGLSVSYGRLREACQTSVDGTSIDTLETLARSLGLDAEQVTMSVDHLFLRESEALPAIVVLREPNGFAHFVVVWSVCGPWVQVMDPARGRRWVLRGMFLHEVYVHTMSLPAQAFREWAASDGFLAPLRLRIQRLALSDGGAALIVGAMKDATWRGLAALDAAVRTVAAVVTAGQVKPGAEAARLVETLVAEATAAAVDSRRVLPAPFSTASAWSRARVKRVIWRPNEPFGPLADSGSEVLRAVRSE